MNNNAIHTENLGKRYKLGETFDRNRTFREAIMELPANFYRKLTSQKLIPKSKWEDPETPPDTFWALRDIDIDIDHGDVVGIIGPNGAGKSTLLKVLSKITYPTKGFARINGRVGSLLEVGTGFHIELTGRENIYLNGSIIGMRKHEIDRKFDEIVDFAGVEKFLDTPIKRFSSGMTVRLAFSVAAHLEPEILIVDEVLAVGDASFQKKCLGKMEDVSKEGRTVLFVSHNMAAVQNLCRRTIVLNNGKIIADGPSTESIRNYLKTINSYDEATPTRNLKEMSLSSDEIALNEISLETADGEKRKIFNPAESIVIRLKYELFDKLRGLRIGFRIITSDGEIVFATTDQIYRSTENSEPGKYESTGLIPANLLNEKEYIISIWAGIPKVKKMISLTEIITFTVEGKPDNGSEFMDPYQWPGVVCPKIMWEINKIQE